jgi:hypothetical protein
MGTLEAAAGPAAIGLNIAAAAAEPQSTPPPAAPGKAEDPASPRKHTAAMAGQLQAGADADNRLVNDSVRSTAQHCCSRTTTTS